MFASMKLMWLSCLECYMKEFRGLHSELLKFEMLQWAGSVAGIGNKRSVYKKCCGNSGVAMSCGRGGGG